MTFGRSIALGAALLAAYVTFVDTDDVKVLGHDGQFEFPGYEIRPLQKFELAGRVLSKKNYSTGRESQLSPTDLAVGWDKMADPKVLADIDVWQRNRWFYWRTDDYPIARREIETHAANIHIIPANQAVAESLSQVDDDDEVRLTGDLVEVVADDGWRWRSSLSRTDTGNRSCELLLLHSLEWI
jgi:hypothetical protein